MKVLEAHFNGPLKFGSFKMEMAQRSQKKTIVTNKTSLQKLKKKYLNSHNKHIKIMYSRSHTHTKKKEKKFYLFQYKSSYRNVIGTNHHELLSTAI